MVSAITWSSRATGRSSSSVTTVPDLRKLVLLPGCGHWTQQERPAEVNAELIAFLQGLGG